MTHLGSDRNGCGTEYWPGLKTLAVVVMAVLVLIVFVEWPSRWLVTQ